MPNTTPDSRYIVVRGRLWRAANPHLTAEERQEHVHALMAARRAVAAAQKAGDAEMLIQARRGVNAAKIALGERGEPWWGDGAPDFNRRMVESTPYRD